MTPYCAIHFFKFVQKYSKIFLIILEYFSILQKMVECMSKDFLFTTIPDVTDIGNSRDPPDLKKDVDRVQYYANSQGCRHRIGYCFLICTFLLNLYLFFFQKRCRICFLVNSASFLPLNSSICYKLTNQKKVQMFNDI